MERQGLSTYCGSECGFLEWRGRRVEECGGKTWQVGDRRRCLITKANAQNANTHVRVPTKDDWWGRVLLLFCIYFRVNPQRADRDSSVGMATRYGLDSPGIESRWRGEIFHTRPDRPWGPPSFVYNRQWVFFRGGKAAGARHCPPTPSSVEVKEKVHLYLYSPSGPSRPVHV